MKLGPVTKLGKRNTVTSKKIDDDVMSANCHAIVIFWSNPEAGFLTHGQLIFSLKVTFYLTKTENRTK